MNKALKISLIAAAGCLAMAGLGAWYAASFVNPTQLTKLLSDAVKESTGRNLTIAGPVSLDLFPSISVKAEQVTLGNASWANNPNFLALKQIELDIKLWPLLKGDVEIDRIGIKGLEANLQTNKAGVGNWNLTPPVLTSKDSQSQSLTENSSDNTSANAFVAIKTIEILDAYIRYQDGNQAEKIITLPKMIFSGGDGKSTVLIDAQYADYKLNLKGKTGLLRNAYLHWDQLPVNVELDLALTLNGKSVAITGLIDKKPKVLPQFDVKLNSQSFDLTPLAGSALIASSVGKSSHPIQPQSLPNSKYFFSDDALPFDLLPVANGAISMDIAQLVIPGQAPFKNLKATIHLKGDQINVNDLGFNIGNGTAQAQISISQISQPTPKVIVKGLAKGFSLEQILATTDSAKKVSGGATQLAINLEGSGASLHQLLSKSNGAIQISIGQSKLDSTFLNKGGDFLITVFDTINPLYKKSNQTALECAVAYLPVTNGIVNIQNSIGVETDRLNVVMSGSVNLRNEVVDININTSEKSGLTTGVDLGGLVKIEGTLQNPKAGVNKAGVVTSAVSIGLGFLTGGISIAAENAKSLATKTQPCKTALHPWSGIYSENN